jgi:uroporphyrinogen decarboxylase
MNMNFTPDYKHFADVMSNKRPTRLPLYEHIICPSIMEKVLGTSFASLLAGKQADANTPCRR